MATLLQRQFSNRAYWEKREREARENYLQTEAQEVAEIERIYRGMAQWAEDEINRFYGKYAGLEGIDIAEAKKRVTKLDIEQYQELAKKYVADRNFSDKASEELRLYNATMRINRLEMLNARIGLDLVAGIDEIDKYCGDKMTERAEAEFRRLAGILGETIDYKDMEKQAKAIVNASFKNATYSERIWSHQDRLRSMINVELQKGLIAGISSRQMASNIRKQYDVSQKDAERLMITELRRVQTDVAMQTYKAEGITQYMYMAVNPRACEVCRAINGKIYNVKEGEVGLNLPPMHPRCHCTTAPWQDPAEYEAWLNWLESGGTTKEWEALPAEDRRRLIETAQELVDEQVEAPKQSYDLQEELVNAYEYHRTANNLNVASYEELQEKGINIITANLGKMSTKDLFTETLADLMRKYDTPLQKVRLMDEMEVKLFHRNAFAGVSHNYEMGSAEMFINPIKCANGTKLVDRIKELCETGYAVQVRKDDYGKYVATHEFAHTLIGMRDRLDSKRNFVGEDYAKVNKVRTEINGIFSEYKAELANLNANYKAAEKAFMIELDAEAGERAKEYKRQYNALKISDYSLENVDEFMAEAFTHSELSDIDNGYANRVRKVIDDNFRR